MFEARCFKPSKLCAIFKLEGVSAEYKSVILKTRGDAKEEIPLPSDDSNIWNGLGRYERLNPA